MQIQNESQFLMKYEILCRHLLYESLICGFYNRYNCTTTTAATTTTTTTTTTSTTTNIFSF